MRTLVKICGITNVEDGLMAAAAGADMIGLMFYGGSPRKVALAQAAEIHRGLPGTVTRVGVFVNSDEETVRRAIGECGLGWLQFHGDEPAEFCARFGVAHIKAIRMRDADSLKLLEQYPANAILLDAYSAKGLGGTGERFNWDLAAEAVKTRRPIFLAGGLTPENASDAVRRVRPFGVDVSSGVEYAPGKKDAGKVRRFIQVVREAADKMDHTMG